LPAKKVNGSTSLTIDPEQDRRVKAVLFDYGETLLSFGKIKTTQLFRQGAKSSYDFLKAQGQPVGNFTFYFLRNLMRIRLRYWLSNLTDRDFDTLVLLEKVGTKNGIRLNPKQWQHLAWLWYEPLSKIAQAEENIAETLKTLKNLDLKLGIVSNTFVNSNSLEKHLKQLDILDYFTVRLYSYEFRYRKPNLEMFRTAAERIGESAENILFVGDRIDNDIKPARRIGMHAVLKEAYTNTGKKVPKGIRKIKQLAELPSLIEKINAATV
jgi:putative hydrolase of the HAD superfamily